MFLPGERKEMYLSGLGNVRRFWAAVRLHGTNGDNSIAGIGDPGMFQMRERERGSEIIPNTNEALIFI